MRKKILVSNVESLNEGLVNRLRGDSHFLSEIRESVDDMMGVVESNSSLFNISEVNEKLNLFNSKYEELLNVAVVLEGYINSVRVKHNI